MHMGDLLRMVHNHPNAEIVGICDETPARMQHLIGEVIEVHYTQNHVRPIQVDHSLGGMIVQEYRNFRSFRQK